MFAPTRYGYSVDRVIFTNGAGRIRQELERWAFLVFAARNFDVIHYNAGTSLLPQPFHRRGRTPAQAVFDAYAHVLALRDVAWLKRLGKAVFVSYLGDDARQGDFAQSHFEFTHANEVSSLGGVTDQAKRNAIARFARHADGIYSVNPDLLWVLPARARFLPAQTVDLRTWRPVPTSPHRVPVVLHAPSDRGVKGTRFVEDAVARLRSENIEFEFVLIENMTRAEARKEYERADILVEQLLLGWYSVLAIELMALGKPVISYIREGDLGFIPSAMRDDIPVINANPNTVYEVLKRCLTTDRAALPSIGEKSRRYVERWHDPLDVAARLKGDYERALAGSITRS